ncbi:MAG: DsbA family protein [Pseudomonadota bacterium]
MLRNLLAAGAVVVAGLAATGAQAQDVLSRGDVETIVREYLLANPEVLEEAFTALQTRRQEAEEEARTASLVAYRDALEASPHDAVIGNPEGDVTLVEFFDYNCGFCRRAMDDLNTLMEEDPNLRVVLKEFPVLGQQSMEAAAVSISVNQLHPEAYGEFHERLMRVHGQADGDVALSIAEEMELPRAALEENMRSDDVRDVVQQGYEVAQALGLSGTPSYVVGDAVEFGAVGYEQLKVRINQARCGEAVC